MEGIKMFKKNKEPKVHKLHGIKYALFEEKSLWKSFCENEKSSIKIAVIIVFITIIFLLVIRLIQYIIFGI